MLIFAYVPGLRGPEPQLWRDKPTNGAGQSKAPLQSIELPDTFADLTIGQLTTLYPYKEKTLDPGKT